jgi:cytochrome P450
VTVESVEGSAESAIDLYDYDDCVHVLRSKEFPPLDETSGFNHEFQMMLLGGALIDLHGEPHFQRRRLLSELFRRVTLNEYESSYLAPAVRDAIAALPAEPDGATSVVDLLQLTRRIMMRLMIRLVGVDGLDTDEAVDRFAGYFEVFEHGARSRYNHDPEPVARRGVAAQAKMLEEFLQPSWDRRQALLDDMRAGRIPAESVPLDMLYLLLQHEDHYVQYYGGGAKDVMNHEAFAFILASVGSTANALCSTVLDITQWVGDDAERARLVRDRAFLKRAFIESIRLRPPNVMYRQATGDQRLPSGIQVPADRVVRIHRAEANHGVASRESGRPDGGAFDPFREMHGVLPYGLGFGNGPHMCIGRAMALGETIQGDDGSSTRYGLGVTILSGLYDAQVTMATETTPAKATDTARETWTRFPVRFLDPSGRSATVGV